MRYMIGAVLALAFLAGYCAGDVVYLKDGRKFEGAVTEAGDKVTVQTKFGAATFSKNDVDRIEKKASAEDVYAEKAKALAAGDAKGHYELGMWCKQNKMSREAKAEFEQTIAIDPDHAEARAELGYSKIDGKWLQAPPGKIYAGEGQWLTPAEAFQNAQAQYKLGQYEAAQKLVEKALEIGVPAEQKMDAQILLATLCERQGKWDDVCAAYDKLLKAKLSSSQKAQIETRKDIIKESKGGMYLIKEAVGKEDIFSIDTKSKTDGPKKVLKGLQPLTDPDVMDLALREKASVRVLKGKDYLDEAKKAQDGTDAGRRKCVALLDQADARFDAANLIVKDIARGFQLESIKQRIGMLQKQLQDQIAAYSGQREGALGAGQTRDRVKAQIPTMYAKLNDMEKTAEQLDQLARKFPDELADQVTINRNLRNAIATEKTYLVNLERSL